MWADIAWNPSKLTQMKQRILYRLLVWSHVVTCKLAQWACPNAAHSLYLDARGEANVMYRLLHGSSKRWWRLNRSVHTSDQ